MKTWNDDEYRWRAALFARIQLTARDDLEVLESSRTIAGERCDLRVRLHAEGTAHDPSCEVLVRAPLRASQWGTTDDHGALLLDAEHAAMMRELAARVQGAETPVLLVVVAMEGDFGWYTWLCGPNEAPVEDPRGADAGDHLKPFDRSGVDHIVDGVRIWYSRKAKAA